MAVARSSEGDVQVSEIEIRPFDLKADVEGAARVFGNAFHYSYWPMIDEADPDLAQDVVRGMVALCNRSLVATDEGEVVGVLLGYVGIEPRGCFAMTRLILARFLPRFVTNRYHLSARARRFLLDLARSWLPIVFSEPVSSPASEILMFCVSSERHGKGIGRKLMDAFVSRAETGGAPRVVLGTDTTMSWQFYQSYGFRRILAVPMNRCYRVALPGEEVTAFIYSLDLDRT